MYIYVYINIYIYVLLIYMHYIYIYVHRTLSSNSLDMTGSFFSPSVCPWDDVEKWTQGLSWTQGQLDERKIVGPTFQIGELFIIIGEFLELSIIIRIIIIITNNLILGECIQNYPPIWILIF